MCTLREGKEKLPRNSSSTARSTELEGTWVLSEHLLCHEKVLRAIFAESLQVRSNWTGREVEEGPYRQKGPHLQNAEERETWVDSFLKWFSPAGTSR